MIRKQEFTQDERDKISPKQMCYIILNNLNKLDNEPEKIKVIVDRFEELNDRDYNCPLRVFSEPFNKVYKFYKIHKHFPDMDWISVNLENFDIQRGYKNYSQDIYYSVVNYLDVQIVRLYANRLGDNENLSIENLDKTIEVMTSYKNKSNSSESMLLSGADIMKIPKREYIVGDILFPKRAFSVVYGEAGTGKSLFLFDLAYSLAEGKEVLGKYKSEPKKVLIIEGDQSAEFIQERIELLGYDFNNENVKFISAFCSTPAYKLIDKDILLSLVRDINLFKPDVVIIDTVMSVFGCDLSKQIDVDPIISTLKTMVDENNMHIILSAHPRKRATGEKRKKLDQSDLMGSSIFQNLAYQMLGMEKIYDDKDNQVESTCVIRCTKSGSGYPAPFIQKILVTEDNKRRIEYDYDISLYEDSFTQKTECVKEDGLLEKVRNTLTRNRDKDIDEKITSFYLTSTFGSGRTQMSKIINILVEEGLLYKEGNGKNTYYKYVKELPEDIKDLSESQVGIDPEDDFNND
ncbi:MAG: AAA family ATPase [bacterium]